MCGDDVVVSIAEGESDVEDGGGGTQRERMGRRKRGSRNTLLAPVNINNLSPPTVPPSGKPSLVARQGREIKGIKLIPT
jgi:hypothetical protein